MRKQILIVGLGRLGMPLATALFDMGHDVLAIDTDDKKVQEAATKITHTVQADATSETVLRELGAGNFDMAIITTGSEVEASVLATILLKKLGVPFIIARANSDLHGTILDKIGADKVVYPEKEMGLRIAREIDMEGITDFIPLGEKYGIARVETPAGFTGQKLGALGFGPRGHYDLAVLLMRRFEEAVVSPDINDIVLAGDILIIAGDITNMERMLSDFKKNGTKSK